MKRLTLMRHGHAQWKDAQIADFDRSLTRRGTAEAEAMSRRLAELGFVPTVLMTSSARRAQQTADIVAKEIGVPARRIRSDESLYLAGAQDILRVVRTLGPRIPHLMIVGHNPGISGAAQMLAAQSVSLELATGAMCSLSFEARAWSGVDASALKDAQSESPSLGLFRMWA